MLMGYYLHKGLFRHKHAPPSGNHLIYTIPDWNDPENITTYENPMRITEYGVSA